MDLLIQYALKFVGVPYIYGGNSALVGIDCSGFVLEILRAAGLWDKSDATAQEIFNKLDPSSSTNVYGAGALAFFGKSVTSISHVAFCVNQYQMIEAGGGDSTTKSVGDAVKRNAMVRMRLIKSRSDLVAVLKPKYSAMGLI